MILSYCNPKYDKYYVYSHSAVVEPTATRTTNNFVGAHRSEQFDISSVFDCRFCCGSAVSRWRIQRIIVSRKNKAFVSKKIFFLKLEGYCVIWCTWDENPSRTEARATCETCPSPPGGLPAHPHGHQRGLPHGHRSRPSRPEP